VVTWIVVAVVVSAFVVLGLAARPVLVRLPRLRRAALRLQQRQQQAESLLAGATALQGRAEVMQRTLATTEQRLTIIKAKRGQ